MTKSVKNVMKGASGLGTVRARLSCLDAVRSESSLSLNGTLGCAGKKTTMKKLMIAASAALCAAVGFGDGITSANVVGYQTTKLADNNFTMLYVPFVHVNNDGKGLQLNQDISCTGLTGGEDAQVADRIWVWNSDRSAYDRFYYYDDGAEAGWVDDANAEYIENIEGWENGIPQGTALFFKSKGTAKSLTGAGAIETEPEVELVLADNNFTMIANPYPVATQLNSNKFKVENVVGGEDAQVSDRIWIWNPSRSAYDRFYYYDDGAEQGWVDDANAEYIENIEGWENGIPAGQGLYFKAKGTGKSVIFGSPLN